jgi:hypothetical protein
LSKPASEKLHVKHGVVKMVAEIVRKKRKILGLNLCRGSILLLQVLDKPDDSALQRSVHGHVQSDVTPHIQPLIHCFRDLLDDDPAQQTVLNDQFAYIIIFLEAGLAMHFAAFNEIASGGWFIRGKRIYDLLQDQWYRVAKILEGECVGRRKGLNHSGLPRLEDSILPQL